MNLRILVHYDRILNAGKLGWSRYVVLTSLLLLLLTLAVHHYLAAAVLLPFAYGVLIRNWRAHIWLCFVLLFYFLVGINRLAYQPGWLDAMVVILTAILFVAAMMYCRWSKQSA